MHGILVVDKPKDYTSRDIVNIVSKKLGTKKVGHTGTLDPLATGVLVLCIGDYTKFVSFFTNHDKEYTATILFGEETDTLDITGTVMKKMKIIPSVLDLQHVLSLFIGKQSQEVPLYSAKKIQGKRLYEYAREGKEVSLPIQNIEVYNLSLLDFQEKKAVISCHVSKGTYIRSLLRDISYACHTVGTMTDLRRTRQGDFSLLKAYNLDEILRGRFKLLSFKDFLSYGIYELMEEEYLKVLNGNVLCLDQMDEYILVTYRGKDIALYQKKEKGYYPLLQFHKNSVHK